MTRRILTHQPIPPQRREKAPMLLTEPISIHGEKSHRATQIIPAITIFNPQEDFIKKNQIFSRILIGRK